MRGGGGEGGGGHAADRVGHPLADLRQPFVEPPAGQPVGPDVAAPGDVGKCPAGTVGGGVRRRSLGVDAVAGGLPGQQPDHGVERRPGREVAAGVVAEHGDPDGPRIVALDVGADDAAAGVVLSRGALHPGR